MLAIAESEQFEWILSVPWLLLLSKEPFSTSNLKICSSHKHQSLILHLPPLDSWTSGGWRCVFAAGFTDVLIEKWMDGWCSWLWGAVAPDTKWYTCNWNLCRILALRLLKADHAVMGWWGDDCRSLGQTPGTCSHVEQFLSFRTHPMADKNLNLFFVFFPLGTFASSFGGLRDWTRWLGRDTRIQEE